MLVGMAGSPHACMRSADALEVRRTLEFHSPDPLRRPRDQRLINLSIGGGFSWYFRIVASPL